MTKTFLAILGLLTISVLTTNAQNIGIKKGQKLESVTSTKLDMNIEGLGQHIESENILTSDIEAVDVSDTGFLFVHTSKRVQIKSNAMGQQVDVDTDKPLDANDQISTALKGTIGLVQRFSVNKNRRITAISSESKLSTPDITQGMNLGTQLAVGQPYQLLMPSEGKPLKKGDVWIDSTGTHDSTQSVFTYTLKEDNGKELILGISNTFKINSVIKAQGMDIQIDVSGTSKGDAVFDKLTGLLLTQNSITEGKGKMGVMGQTTSISMVSKNSMDVKKLD